MPDAVFQLALQTLRSNAAGELRFDEHQQRVKYVIDPATGKIVLNVMVAMLQAIETVLFIPEERDGAMELLVTLEPIEVHSRDEALADRWRIYHGEAIDMHWAICSIDAARHDEFVIDGEGLMQPNPLSRDEPKLCKLFNDAGPEKIAAITFNHADRKLEAPVVVGVDALGVDVRARFEIVRINAPQPFVDADDARKMIEAWIADA